MIPLRIWLGLALGLCAAPTAAQESAPQAPAAQQLAAVVETDATREAAAAARDELQAATELRGSGEKAQAREALHESLANLLAVPGREASAEIADALDALGTVAKSLNDTECVVQACEPVLAFRIATLGVDDARVQVVRATLGTSFWSLGRLDESQTLLGAALDWARRTCKPDDPRLTDALSNYAVTLYYKADYERANSLMTEVIETLLKKTGADDPEIQWAFANQGNILDRLGDVDGAVANRERVHRILCKARPADHQDVMIARHNLALSLRRAGDPIAARELLQSALVWDEAHYPPGHLAIERTRDNLSLILLDIGDFDSARILLEGILERLEQKGLDDDPACLNAKEHLIIALKGLGRGDEALSLSLKLLEQMRRLYGEDGLETLHATTVVGTHLFKLGKLSEARTYFKRVLETLEEHYPDGEYDLMNALGNCATSQMANFGPGHPEKMLERALAIAEKRLGKDHETTLRLQCSLADALEDRSVDPVKGHALLRDVGERLLRRIAAETPALSPREAELRAHSFAYLVDVVLARCKRPEDARLGFELVEQARLAAWAGTRAVAALDRACAANGDVRKLRDALRAKSALVAEFAQSGRREDYQKAALERGELEQRLAAAVSEFAAAAQSSAEPAQIAARLAKEAVAISFRRYQYDGDDPGQPPTAGYIAFVLRGDGSLRRVELGAASEIESSVARWRAALGIDGTAADAEAQRHAGEDLRSRVVDPLRDAAGDAKRWIVTLDDVLHLIPLEALAFGNGVVGDTTRIEVRTHQAELAQKSRPIGVAQNLVALGGIDFDALPAQEPAAAAPADPTLRRGASLANSGERLPPRPSHFVPLPATAEEVAGVAGVFDAHAPAELRAKILDGKRATKAALIELAPQARWLHIATHGFYADTLTSIDDASRTRGEFESEIRGLSPRVLCGLALAGANAPEDVSDRGRGVLSAEELAYLDLDGCELAVLSACDSSLGVRHGGQSVASLQSALHAAGARSAITALWSVSDESTRALMLAFYRGLWDEKLSKGDALWRAKNELRARRAPTREWAAWVLSGDPR